MSVTNAKRPEAPRAAVEARESDRVARPRGTRRRRSRDVRVARVMGRIREGLGTRFPPSPLPTRLGTNEVCVRGRVTFRMRGSPRHVACHTRRRGAPAREGRLLLKGNSGTAKGAFGELSRCLVRSILVNKGRLM